jgi:hypothetical protein
MRFVAFVHADERARDALSGDALECDDLDHAIASAVRIPVVGPGSVELRPIVER